jgi:glutamyl-tRNA reductase
VVAAGLTRTIFETLDVKTIMLIGAGKMSWLVARHLKARGSGANMVTTRTFDHAVELAREFGGLCRAVRAPGEYRNVPTS